jgi:hypothetical protein
MAERTGCPILLSLWSYVSSIFLNLNYIPKDKKRILTNPRPSILEWLQDLCGIVGEIREPPSDEYCNNVSYRRASHLLLTWNLELGPRETISSKK